MINWLVRLIPVFYTDLDSSIKGRILGFIIQIGNKYKEDKGLLAHERCHVRQFWKLGMLAIMVGALLVALGYVYGILFLSLIPIHIQLYKYNLKYRYKCEIEAYGYSLVYGNRTIQNVKWVLEKEYLIPQKIMKDFNIDMELSMNSARKDIDELVK